MKRREFIKNGCRATAILGISGTAYPLIIKNLRKESGDHSAGKDYVWQIDPEKCIGCSECAYKCVLTESAVKCFHNEKLCGFCEICTGFFDEKPIQLNEGAENQLCPVNAIRRQKVEANYYEYIIDREHCIGCGKCVKGCTDKGNGSLFLQIDQSICKQCNQCAIAIYCPAQAISLVSSKTPYRMK
ncbi:MAG: ferredoxin [Planctomycetia bacterium]|nr:ferredoxin [Planctomycetia bacterium]